MLLNAKKEELKNTTVKELEDWRAWEKWYELDLQKQNVEIKDPGCHIFLTHHCISSVPSAQ